MEDGYLELHPLSLDEPGLSPQTIALRTLANAGHPHGGHVPFGYQDVDAPECWAPHPDEAPMVRELFRRVAAEEPLTGILRDFEERGLCRRDGEPLTRSSAVAILDNVAYPGYRASQGQLVAKGVWEPLVPVEEFLAVRAILEANRQDGGRVTRLRQNPYLLSGIALCGACGRTMGHGQYSGKGKRIDIYQCYQRGSHKLGRSMRLSDETATEALLDMAGRITKPGPLFELAHIPAAKRREYWDRLPMERRRGFLREGLTITILPVGKGKRAGADGFRIEQKAER